MNRLDDKVAVITGACGGIGNEAARLFCSAGAKVLMVDLDAAALEEAADTVDGEVSSFSGRSVTYLVVIAAPEVADVTITSTPAAGGIYAPGETISVQLTFTE
ncbi:MAG: SDR family NAD(P)-dependent oxidoreductase, partial [Dehalococcoidia bacterium]|nr:SDR family NAD(P)-dependent oxidoreductase [Dehalococcoidia bacterium]